MRFIRILAFIGKQIRFKKAEFAFIFGISCTIAAIFLCAEQFAVLACPSLGRQRALATAIADTVDARFPFAALRLATCTTAREAALPFIFVIMRIIVIDVGIVVYRTRYIGIDDHTADVAVTDALFITAYRLLI